MSRIEEAMEKANRLRESAAGGLPSPPAVSAPAEPPSSNNGSACPEIEISNPRLVAANNYSMPIAEEYRKLKSFVVQECRKAEFCNTLMVTSCVGSEGKSLTGLNLAISLAQEYDTSVLLVDADLRNPSVLKYLGVKAERGLSDCLLDGVPLEEVLINTGLGNLSLLPAGRRIDDPVELLASAKMKSFFSSLKERYRSGYVVVDTSPVLPFAEPRVLSHYVDAVLFIVKEGGPSLKNIHDAMDALHEATILGMVYNQATTAGLSGGYHYYYYDYSYRPRSLNPSPKKSVLGKLTSLFGRNKQQ